MAASNSEKQSSKSSVGDGSSLSSSERQKSSPASVDGGSSRWKYDVFLSFRGEDTRNNFTSHLYAALSQKGITLKDDGILERGTDFSPELTKAIEESRFSIVIFSKNYASCTRCLEELAKIVECMETNNLTVIPVFYDVEQSDVRKQKGEFKEAFDKHELDKHHNNKVQRWREALTRVSNITGGYDPIYGRPEAQCIKDIVDYIWTRLKITFSSDTVTDDAISVSEISQLKRLPRKLYSLKIEACKDLESLPEELMSVNLQQLYIIDCQYLKSIQASHLPIALKTLYIRRCKKLEFLSAEETTGKHSSVEHLCIESSCDPLKSFPLALFPKLRNLSISDCANFNSISITEDHNTLNSLEIRDCTNLESLWKSGLGTPKLTSILLSNCKKLKQLPGQLHGLTSLQSLFIKECPELDSIPVGGLPSSLNLLRISSCHKLTPRLQWGLHQLNNFIRFEIEGGCGDLESFPEQNLLPMSLNSLEISTFPNLKVLNYEGLQHLTSLQTLKINSCDKLQFLPEEGLPSSLSYLYISDCPLLKSKLQNRGGSEWYKIDHIPHIQIDGKVIS